MVVAVNVFNEMSLSVSKTKTRMWSNGRNANQPTNKGQSREKKTKNRICKLEAVCVSVTIGKLGVGEGRRREGGRWILAFIQMSISEIIHHRFHQISQSDPDASGYFRMCMCGSFRCPYRQCRGCYKSETILPARRKQFDYIKPSLSSSSSSLLLLLLLLSSSFHFFLLSFSI